MKKASFFHTMLLFWPKQKKNMKIHFSRKDIIWFEKNKENMEFLGFYCKNCHIYERDKALVFSEFILYEMNSEMFEISLKLLL